MRSRAANGTRGRLLRRRRGEDGAALVEFAFIAMPLFLILFATMEFGWAFFQLNDVRHGAREGIRLVAVNADPATTAGAPADQGEHLAQAACERMDRSVGVTITITIEDLDPADPSGNHYFDVGDDATLTATKPLDQLTHVFDPILSSVELEETITTRLEQDWWDEAASADGLWELDPVEWTCA